MNQHIHAVRGHVTKKGTYVAIARATNPNSTQPELGQFASGKHYDLCKLRCVSELLVEPPSRILKQCFMGIQLSIEKCFKIFNHIKTW